MSVGADVAALSPRAPRYVYLSDQDTRRFTGSTQVRYGWRLDAANHRPLARSIALWPSEDGCRAGADVVHRRVGDLDTSVRSVDGEGDWRWHASLDGEDVTVSVHAYPRRVECARALRQALDAFRRAEPAEGVVRHFGPAALRAYGGPAQDTRRSADVRGAR